ncbi:MAG: class I SAM-dependent methyltransferase [Anaerolineae bacterium]|nr:class I SAM-dependent methyltransferase [Anaerolineae bacterium]
MTDLPTVNYDTVAPTYDQRLQGGTYLAEVATALQALAGQVQAQRVLDLGCGTGRSLQSVWAELARFGLDLSSGMLAQAQRLEPDYRLVQASAPRPPFAPHSFDLIFCAHAFHHFPHKPQVVEMAYRLLRPGGALAIVNIDPREAGQSWPVYDYFEGTYETDLARFPAVAEQEAWLGQAGFQQISSPVVQRIESELHGAAIFEDYYLRKESNSQLILLSDEAYQAGLKRMRDHLKRAEAARETVIFRTVLINRMCHGFK